MRSKWMLAWLLCAGLGVASCTSTEADGSTSETYHVAAVAVAFDSLEDMTAASDIVFVGRVVEVKDGDFNPAPDVEDFQGYQNLDVVIEINEVLKGDAIVGDTRRIAWNGYKVEADGSRGAQAIVNGQAPPAVDDMNVWFLGDSDGRYGLIAYEGRLSVENDRALVLPPEVESGAADDLAAMDLDGLRAFFERSGDA